MNRLLIIFCILSFMIGAQENFPQIRTTGIGKKPENMKGPRTKLMARKAAKQVAVRNLLAKIKGGFTQPDHPSSVQKLEGFIAAVQYGDPVTLEDGSVQVEATLSVSVLLQNYQMLIMELEEKNEELNSGKKMIEETQRTLGQVSEELNAKTHEWKILVEKENNWEEKNTQLQAQIESLKSQEQIQQEQLLRTTELLHESREKEKNWLLSLEKLRKENNVLQEKLEELTAQLKKNEEKRYQEIGKWKKELRDNNLKLSALKVRYKEQHKALQAFRQQIEQYQKKADNPLLKKTTQTSPLPKEIEYQKEKYKILEEQNRHLQERNKKLLTMLSRLSIDHSELWSRHETVSVNLAQMRDRINYAQKEIEAAKKSQQQAEKRYQKIWLQYYKSTQISPGNTNLENWLKKLLSGQKSMQKDLEMIKLWFSNMEEYDYEE